MTTNNDKPAETNNQTPAASGNYVPTTSEERQAMLEVIGKPTVEALFADIPEDVRLTEPLKIPGSKSEMEVVGEIQEIADKNTVFRSIFRGAGAYNHYIPAIVNHVASKEEFVTAYTPYQPEISQGVLQSIFEYQTMICTLSDMYASNASVYDGATAAAEAFIMCMDKRKTTAFVSETTNPQVIAVIQTYCKMEKINLVLIPQKNGVTDTDALGGRLDQETACVYVQQPNFFGLIEDAEKIGAQAHNVGAKFIMGFHPIAAAVLKTPGECGADIAVGEGQPLGLPLAFGGPYLGMMACKKEMLRKLPGRIVGQTKDADGNRAFVLTLQAREQHIRREKASSSICSNQALCALRATAYLGAMGPGGLSEVAEQCMAKARYAAKEIASVKGFALRFENQLFFNEFVTSCPEGLPVEQVMERLEENGILGGYPLEGELRGSILWCVTEMNTKKEIDRLVHILRSLNVASSEKEERGK